MPEEKNNTARWAGASSFKYYIHDGNACTLQLLGNLTEADLPDLIGCWRTAKTTLNTRKLVIDVRCLTSVDAPGRMWLGSMAAGDAEFLPKSFSPSVAFTPAAASIAQSKLPIFARIGSLLRGFRTADPAPSRPAQ